MQLYKYTISMLILMALFAFAFGFNEAAISHYLGVQAKDSSGKTSFFSKIDNKTLNIEKARELAALFIMFFVTMLTRGTFFRKFASFVFMFGIWDLTYYITLKKITGLPSSFFEWTILFLYPYPWMAPMIVPFIISIIGIIGAVIVHFTYDIKSNLKIDSFVVLFIIISLSLWLFSFLARKDLYSFPEKYNWILFFSGLIFSLASYLRLIKLNWLK